MRVLVEQTAAVASEALARAQFLWDPREEHLGSVGVHLLMGGTGPDSSWDLYPEECAVLIGTQDMLLSRALNRGYGAGRARWPREFGLLNHDALWIIDEAQLMDVGLATTAQLQAYLDEDASKGLRPRHCWWMSATLQAEWLRSVDTMARVDAWQGRATAIPAHKRRGQIPDGKKALRVEALPGGDDEKLARLALAEHRQLAPGENGRVSLVVCNTVARAVAVYREISALAPAQELRLVHSRFRPAERREWRDQFLSRPACHSEADRIIVATQVVEAGVDVSAGCVVSDLAPWPSLVQRFGRCARYGGSGVCVVVDRGASGVDVLPYDVPQLEGAREALAQVQVMGADVSPLALDSFEASLDPQRRERLYPYFPGHLLLRHEFEELFDTTPDLTGADLDISRFIRRGEERDIHLFWRDIPPPEKGARSPRPPRSHRPAHDELCAVPFLAVRDWLCGDQGSRRLRPGVRAWVWDFVDGEWIVAQRSSLLPGRTVCIASASGGYHPDRGFDPACSKPVTPVPIAPLSAGTEAFADSDDADSNDGTSVAGWKTIACHSDEVQELVDALSGVVAVPASVRRVLSVAARWHDVGKSHSAFQGAITRRPPGMRRPDLAKAPDDRWSRPYGTADGDERPGLRHELASALALFSVLSRYSPGHAGLLGGFEEALRLLGAELPRAIDDLSCASSAERLLLDCSAEEFDLVAYLVATHHGKVRVSLHAGPKDQDYRDGDGRGLPIRGVRDRDVLPSMRVERQSVPLPSFTMSLAPAGLGLSPSTGRSWRERVDGLVRALGPGCLAWLEALLVAADRRASMLDTRDPELIALEQVTR
jgi:CRISPR-associated endonuclease/helicase Cas3